MSVNSLAGNACLFAVKFAGAGASALFAMARAAFEYQRVFLRKLMAVFAVGHSSAHGKHGCAGSFYIGGNFYDPENFFNRFSIIKPPHHGFLGDIQFLCPLSQCQGFPFKRDFYGPIGVVRLLFMSSPLAVFWTIWPVIIDALQRAIIGRETHIGIKQIEFLPSQTDCYSSATIAIKARCFWVCAPRMHSAPYLMRTNRCENFGYIQHASIVMQQAE